MIENSRPALEDLDLYELQRLLDVTKSMVFSGKGSAFYGPLLSYLNFTWVDDIPTAATNGLALMWNPHWFLKLEPKVRYTVLMHELDHVARLHMVRTGPRDPLIWNYTCDIRINNDLYNAGYSFKNVSPWMDHSFDKKELAAEEDIYDALIAMLPDDLEELKKSLVDSWGAGNIPGGVPDMISGEPDANQTITAQDVVSAVISSVHQAKLSNKAGDIPGTVEKILKQFLAPVVPWETVFYRFFQELLEHDHTWARPRRRTLEIAYLPTEFEDAGRLEHLIYYEDVSGSITDAQVIRFNSELKYVWDTLKPKKMTVVQFDTVIQNEFVLNEGDEFEEVKIVGRGGTCLICVREHMMKHKPTAAVIFSDLGCEPMEPLDFDVPTIWVAISNTKTPIPFGTRVNIRG